MSRYIWNAPRLQRVIPPYLGLDTNSAPEAVKPEKGLVHQNWLLDRPGKTVMRGSFSQVASSVHKTTLLTTKALAGVMVWQDRLAFHYATVNPAGANAGFIAPWESFWKKATNDNQLIEASPTDTDAIHVVDLLAGTDTTNTFAGTEFGTVTLGWGNGTRFGNWTYQPSIESGVAGVDVGQGYLRKETTLTAWGGATSGNVPSSGGFGPWNATPRAGTPNFLLGLRAHYNRLFVIAAKDPTGATAAPNFSSDYNPAQLYWTRFDPQGGTNLGGFGPGNLSGSFTDWQNPNTSFLNKLTVGQIDENEAAVAIAKIQRNLMIFKRRTVYVLYGYSDDTWAIRQVSRDLGCADPRSVVEHDNTVIFCSLKGMYLYDGARFVNISKDIQNIFLPFVKQRVGPQGSAGGFVIANVMPTGYVHVSVGVRDWLTGAETIDFNGYYYPPTDSWSNLTVGSGIFFSSGPTGCTQTNNFFVAYDERRYFQGQNIFMPEQESSLGVDSFGGTKVIVNAKFNTRLYGLSSPVHTSILNRYYLDYYFQTLTGGDGAIPGWFISAKNGIGQTLIAEAQVASQGNPTSFTYRRRHMKDTYRETGNAADITLAVEWRGTDPNPPVLKKAEVYNADFLFQTSTDRRQQ